MNRKETWARLVGLGVTTGEMPDASWELKGANLPGVDLSGANLSESRLSKTNFCRADLSEANLSFVDLYGANLGRANLSGANLARANLARANLSGANLSEANLSEANLSEANLSEANLNKVELFAANFRKADLKNVNLREAIVIDTDFSQADLSGSDITASVVWGVSTTGWTIDGIKAEYIFFCRSDEEDKEKRRRDFEKGQFELLFKSVPMVELIFEERLGEAKLFALMALIKKTSQQFPELGIGLEHIVAGTFKTRVIIRVSRDEDLSKTAKLIQDGVNRFFPGVSDETLAPLLSQLLMPNSSESIVENVVPTTFQLIKADGTLFGVSSRAKGIYKPWIRS